MPVVVVHAADGLPEWLTGVGALLGGLALPLAFVQLHSLQQDRRRGQVDGVAAWPEEPSSLEQAGGELWWSVRLRVRNGSQLPVFVESVDVEVEPWGVTAVLAMAGGESELPGVDARNVRAGVFRGFAQPGVVAPGVTWGLDMEYRQDLEADQAESPRITVAEVLVTDSAGRRWRIRPRLGGARRVYRWKWRRGSR